MGLGLQYLEKHASDEFLFATCAIMIPLHMVRLSILSIHDRRA
jgi:hypothetical protein